jgi:hypothetical protein
MGWLITDVIHRIERTVKATAALTFLLMAPGWALFAVAWMRREGR